MPATRPATAAGSCRRASRDPARSAGRRIRRCPRRAGRPGRTSSGRRCGCRPWGCRPGSPFDRSARRPAARPSRSGCPRRRCSTRTAARRRRSRATPPARAGRPRRRAPPRRSCRGRRRAGRARGDRADRAVVAAGDQRRSVRQETKPPGHVQAGGQRADPQLGGRRGRGLGRRTAPWTGLLAGCSALAAADGSGMAVVVGLGCEIVVLAGPDSGPLEVQATANASSGTPMLSAARARRRPRRDSGNRI